MYGWEEAYWLKMRFYCKKDGYTLVTNTLRIKKVCCKCPFWDECYVSEQRDREGNFID